MKYLSRSLTLLLAVIVTVGLNGCKDKKKSGPGPDDLRLEELAGAYKTASSKTWNISTVLYDGVENRTDSWTGFSLTISTDGNGGMTYSTANGLAGGPWPANGSFTFDESTGNVNINQLIRDDGLEIIISSDGTSLEMTFTFDSATHSSGKTEAVDGEYKFTFS